MSDGNKVVLEKLGGGVIDLATAYRVKAPNGTGWNTVCAPPTPQLHVLILQSSNCMECAVRSGCLLTIYHGGGV